MFPNALGLMLFIVSDQRERQITVSGNLSDVIVHNSVVIAILLSCPVCSVKEPQPFIVALCWTLASANQVSICEYCHCICLRPPRILSHLSTPDMEILSILAGLHKMLNKSSS